MNIYKEANQKKLRFFTDRGNLSTEQLYDLSENKLKELIKQANQTLVNENPDSLSFLDEVDSVDPISKLRFEILKDIYLTKKSEREAATTKQKNEEHNQKILSLIAKKQEDQLTEMSVEDLEKMLK